VDVTSAVRLRAATVADAAAMAEAHVRAWQTAFRGIVPADGYDTATLWTLAACESTRAFYEAQGWWTDGVVTPWEDWDGVPLVRYCMTLPTANPKSAPRT